MASGQNRFDFDLGAVLRGRKQGLLVDGGSDVSDPVEFVEESYPEVNADEALAVTIARPEATRVVVVGNNDADYARSSWHGYTAAVFSSAGTGPQRIVSANLARNNVSVRNLHATLPVYLGSTSEEASATGYALPAGTEHTFYHTAEVWALTRTATAADHVDVAIAAEYNWPID